MALSENAVYHESDLNFINDIRALEIIRAAKPAFPDTPIWQAETKAKANAAFDFFNETYGVKWDKAVAKLVKDRDALLTFYDFPAERAQALANTSGQATRSKAPSPPSGIEPSAPRDVSAERPGWPWPSS